MKEILINTINDLCKELNALPNHYIYRGHSNLTWKLEPTIERIVQIEEKERLQKYEDYTLKIFQSSYHIYKENEHLPEGKLSWLSLMQHYGIPTRLLDFTESVYIALYFAFESFQHNQKENIALYAINYKKLKENSKEYIKNSERAVQVEDGIYEDGDKLYAELSDKQYEVLWITEPSLKNKRMDKQRGTFLISINNERTIESLLVDSRYKECVVRYIINRDLHEEIFNILRKMNINAKTIYGDLAGLAQSIKMELQIYAHE